jgi:hypothetical protein
LHGEEKTYVMTGQSVQVDLSCGDETELILTRKRLPDADTAGATITG